MPYIQLDFTDGDTFKRFTITDANCTASSKIIPHVQPSAPVTETADLGYAYDAYVASYSAGSFDVVIGRRNSDVLPVTATLGSQILNLLYLYV